MKVLICGSRDWADADTIAERLVDLAPDYPVILHGGASGADLLADGACSVFGYEVRAFPANWKKYGKRAGILRNLQMLNEGPDLVIAFQRNGSRGTQHTIDEARKRGIPVEVHTA